MSAPGLPGLELGFEDDPPGFDDGGGAPTGPALRAAGLPVDTVRAPLTAAALLARFRAHRAQWFAGLDAESDGIEAQLAREAELSARLGGLPCVEHRSLWDRGADRSRPRHDQRSAEWQPPLWAITPIVRQQGGSLKLRLPPSLTPSELQEALLAHCPPAWRRHERVHVRLEIETRLYWGARARDDQSPWRLACERGDGIGVTDELMEIEQGRIHWKVSQADAVAPVITRSLRAGVGLLVAVPVLLYEKDPRALGPFRRWVQGALDWFDRLRGLRPDRDPTFVERLQADERYWSAALGIQPPGLLAMRQAGRTGARLAPASRAALRPVDDAAVQVVLLHGGLTSARAAFDAWLGEDPSRPPLWQGMPLLDELPVWRFEHDSFLAVKRNIDDLTEALQQQIIRRRPRGRLVLLAHSRGGVIARFALNGWRDRWPDWDFHALAAGSPLDGTDVFQRLGQRWVGVAGAVGLVGRALRDIGSRSVMAKLKNLERGMAGDIPEGFRDLLPANIRNEELRNPWPRQLTTWGSHWRAEVAAEWQPRVWRHLIEDFAGFEADGDGMIPLESAMRGPDARNASPAFHTEYFEHEPTAQQIRALLAQLTQAPSPAR